MIDDKIDDMEDLIRFVLLSKVDGYAFDGVFRHKYDPTQGTLWGVRVIRPGDNRPDDVQVYISSIPVPYSRADIEQAIYEAIQEAFKDQQPDNEIDEKINKISDYYAQSIRLAALLRRMRRWYCKKISQ